MAIKVSIIGLAKSGTSALYTAIKTCLPAPRRLMFEPKTAEELCYITDGHTDNALTKLMFSQSQSQRIGYDPQAFSHNVAIVRDPRDTIISSVLFQFNRLKLLNDTHTARRMIAKFEQKETDPRSISIVEILEAREPGMAEKLRSNIEAQLDGFARYLDNGTHHIITFDQMIEGDFDKLNDYLGLQLATPERLDGWIGKISRKGDSGDWKNWFCPSDVEFFRPTFDPYLKKYGFNLDWTLSDTPEISPEHCSLYIRRLGEARRQDPNLKHGEISDMAALRSAAEDGKINALTRLVTLLTEEGTAEALDEAAIYSETMGQMGMRKYAVSAGRHFARNGQRDRAIALFRQAIKAGAVVAHHDLAHQLLAKKDPALFDEAVAVLKAGAELQNAKCQERLEKLGV